MAQVWVWSVDTLIWTNEFLDVEGIRDRIELYIVEYSIKTLEAVASVHIYTNNTDKLNKVKVG